MAQRILIMGLPGSGKTTLASALKSYLEENGDIEKINPGKLLNKEAIFVNDRDFMVEVDWFNADDVRRKFNDWDFSKEGRIRQSLRMLQFALECSGEYVICDFVAPLVEMRNNFKADWTIWVDTIREGRYEDTNKAFVEPDVYDFRITEQNAEKWAEFIGDHILANRRRPVFDWKKETVQMLGRWQPWHDGHRALFERLIARTGQVVIQVRDVQGWQGSNPFEVEKVKSFIRRDLDPIYQGQYEIQVVPNIVHIGWGRGVGYTAGEETFDEKITNISATKIRKELGLK
jgi:GTPase SAR1 family protein